jgi:CHAT domain-containing protein
MAAKLSRGVGHTTHAEEKSVIHLATHGFFLGGDCSEAPTSARGVGGVAPLQEQPAENLDENLLLACWFAVTGAKRRTEAGPGEEDGILTAEEIAVVDITGVDLVVLSACDTGLGVIRSGEGVFELRRAF